MPFITLSSIDIASLAIEVVAVIAPVTANVDPSNVKLDSASNCVVVDATVTNSFAVALLIVVPPALVLYAKLFQAVEPSPTLNLVVSDSYPNSPAAKVGLADDQSDAVSLLNCICVGTMLFLRLWPLLLRMWIRLFPHQYLLSQQQQRIIHLNRW